MTREQALQFSPIITAVLSNERVHRLAPLIGLRNAKTRVQRVALGPFSWLDLLLHRFTSTTGANGTSRDMIIIQATGFPPKPRFLG